MIEVYRNITFKWWLCSLIAIAYSYLGSRGVLIFGGVFAPEVVLAPLILVYGSAIYNRIGEKNIYFLMLSILLVSAVSVIGFARDDFSASVFYARYRALLSFVFALIIGMVVFKNNDERHIRFIAAIFLWVGFFNLISQLLYSGLEDGAAKAPMSASALTVSAVLYWSQRLRKEAWICLALMSLSAVLSFFRQNYIYASLMVVGFLASYIFQVIGRRRMSDYIGVVVVILAVSLLPLILSDYVIYFMESSESRYIQSIKKIEALSDALSGRGFGESENTRIEMLLYLSNNFNYYLLPNGLVNDSTLTMKSLFGGSQFHGYSASLVRDSILAYFVIQFGWLITFLVVVVLFFMVLRGFLFALKRSEFFIYVALTFSLILEVFVGGLSMVHFERSLSFGFFAAVIFRFSNLFALSNR